MEIKTFEFNLDISEEGAFFSIEKLKRNELKLFDTLDSESKLFSEDFKSFQDTFENDPDRDSILSMLLFRGWQAVYETSPLFNIENEPERVRNELADNDV
jgi:hypothetical protein